MLFSFSPCGQLLVFLGHCRVCCSVKFIIILAFKARTYIEFAFRCQLAVLGYYRTRCSVKFILFYLGPSGRGTHTEFVSGANWVCLAISEPRVRWARVKNAVRMRAFPASGA